MVSTRDKIVSSIILGSILVLAAVLRFDRARADGLTFDELWHLALSTGRGSPQTTLPTNRLIEGAPPVTSLSDAPPIWNVWTNMEGVTHPPLFVAVLRIWRTMFGESDLAAKSLPIVCALVAIALLYDAIKTHMTTGIGRCAALLFAVAPAQIYLSQQVRGYAMAQMFACGVIAAIVRIEKLGASRSRLIALSACASALALTHYFGVLALVAVAAYVLIRLRNEARKHTMIALACSAAILLITWAPFMWRLRNTVTQTADPWLAEPAMSMFEHIRLTLGRFIALPVRQIAEPTNAAFQWPLIVGAMVLIASIALGLRMRRELLIWLTWVGGTMFAVMWLDLFRNTRQLMFPRYTSLAAPAIFALIASIRPPKYALPAIAIAFALFMHPTAFTRDDEPEWRKLGQAIDQHCQPGEPLIFYSGGQVEWYHKVLFLGASRYSHAFPRDIVRLTQPPMMLDRDTAWIISGPLDRPVEQIVPGATVTEQYFLPEFALLTKIQISPPAK